MLPKVFTISDLLYGYIDHKAGLIVVDTSNANKAELLLSKLRECLDGLPCVPVSVNNDVSENMTEWLKDRLLIDDDDNFDFGNEVELREPDDGGAIAKIKNQDLAASEIDEHLTAGKLVTKLALTWQDKISFILSTDLTISRIKFLNIESTGETPAERFDSDFALMTGEFTQFFNDLFELFGGINNG